MASCFVTVDSGGQFSASVYQFILSDFVIGDANAFQLYDREPPKAFVRFLAKDAVQKYVPEKVNRLMLDRYLLGKFLRESADKYDEVYAVFFNWTFMNVHYPLKVLQEYKKLWPNVRYIMLYLDTAARGASSYANALCQQGLFDLVYSFDPEDAKNNDWIYWRTPYTKLTDSATAEIERDLYYVGSDAGRDVTLQGILKLASAQGVQAQMDISTWSPEKYVEYPDMVIMQRIAFKPYLQALHSAITSNCILDVTRDEQRGLTLRPYEAVVYNRKLLTDNPEILNFPYYDPRYMQYYKTADDIDWDWVKSREPVDYRYQGEYSPIQLKKDIVKRLGNHSTVYGKLEIQ